MSLAPGPREPALSGVGPTCKDVFRILVKGGGVGIDDPHVGALVHHYRTVGLLAKQPALPHTHHTPHTTHHTPHTTHTRAPSVKQCSGVECRKYVQPLTQSDTE